MRRERKQIPPPYSLQLIHPNWQQPGEVLFFDYRFDYRYGGWSTIHLHKVCWNRARDGSSVVKLCSLSIQ